LAFILVLLHSDFFTIFYELVMQAQLVERLELISHEVAVEMRLGFITEYCSSSLFLPFTGVAGTQQIVIIINFCALTLKFSLYILQICMEIVKSF